MPDVRWGYFRIRRRRSAWREAAANPVFTKCIFCHNDLGANEIIERFPIGRRLAFDEAKGRLWVVCPSCSRWNLTPIEERWEAIEDCERRFRGTHLRLSTDHIGLARLSEGLELVRVGKPQRPEMAAWRYGAKFRARRIKSLAMQGAGYAAMAALVAINPTQLVQLAIQTASGNFGRRRRPPVSWGQKVIARFENDEGREYLLKQDQAARVVLLPARVDSDWGILVRHSSGRYSDNFRWGDSRFTNRTVLRGERAAALIKPILPVVNYAGAKDAEVKGALGYLDKYETSTSLFNHAAGIASKIGWKSETERGELANLPPEYRLALEMVANEDTERRALEGELQLLEDAWREAEEIAAISDNLLLPKSVAAIFARMKARKTEP